MAATGTVTTRAAKATRRRAFIAVGAVLLVGAIALDSKIVTIGSDEDLRQQVFDPDRFGRQSFPSIQSQMIERAPDAATLAQELAADKKAAVAKYGTSAGAFAVMPVSFTGSVGEGKSGIFTIAVDGLPDGTAIRVQTGPAINGTELRDFPGDIEFGAFKNQIEFQDAGAGINRAMAAEVLADLDRDTLTGKTIVVTGAFTMINPKNWLVTPVSFEVLQ
jgi:predicted lipoprotein